MAGAVGVSVRIRGREEEGQKRGKEEKKEEGDLNGREKLEEGFGAELKHKQVLN